MRTYNMILARLVSQKAEAEAELERLINNETSGLKTKELNDIIMLSLNDLVIAEASLKKWVEIKPEEKQNNHDTNSH